MMGCVPKYKMKLNIAKEALEACPQPHVFGV
jgi:hypothetical protein